MDNKIIEDKCVIVSKNLTFNYDSIGHEIRYLNNFNSKSY
jgi:hypothetical protein